jgi:O-antigen/teichoic acid export membrane protein
VFWNFADAKLRGRLTDVALVYVSQASAALFPLLIAPFIARVSGVEVLGEYSLLIVAAQLGVMVTEYSFDAIGPRLIAVATADGIAPRAVLSQVLRNKLTLVGAGLIVAILCQVVLLRRVPTAHNVFGILALMVGTALQSNWFLLSTGQARIIAISGVSGRLLSLILVGLAWVWKVGSDYYFVVTAIGSLTSGVFAMSLNRERVGVGTLLRPSADLISEGRSAFMGSAASALQNVLGQGLAGVVTGAAGAGTYAAVDRIARGLSAAFKPIFLTMYPRMAALHASNPTMAVRVLIIGLGVVAVASTVALSLSVMFGQRVIELIYGAQMAGSGPLLVVLTAWLCFGIANNLIGIQGLLASGRDRLYLQAMWVGLIATACAGAVAKVMHGQILDVGFAVLTGEVAISIGMLWRIWRRSKGK